MSYIGDTDCPLKIAGMEFVKNLGLARNDILPIEMSTIKVNETTIDIISMVITDIKVEGTNTVVKQIVHITSNTTEVLLNRVACKHLGLTTEQPPQEWNEVKLHRNKIHSQWRGN